MGLPSSLRFIVGVYQKAQKHLMLKSQISQSKYMFKVMIFLAVLGDLCGPTNIQTYHPWFPCTIRIDFYRRVSQKVCNTYKFTLSTRGSVFLFGGNYIRSFIFDSLTYYKYIFFSLHLLSSDWCTKDSMRGLKWWIWWDNRSLTFPRLSLTLCTLRHFVGNPIFLFCDS